MPSSPTSQSCLMGPRHPPRGAAGGSSDCLKLESSSAGLPGPESSGERAPAPASFYVPLISDQTNSIVNPAGSCLICPEADESAGRRSHFRNWEHLRLAGSSSSGSAHHGPERCPARSAPTPTAGWAPVHLGLGLRLSAQPSADRPLQRSGTLACSGV